MYSDTNEKLPGHNSSDKMKVGHTASSQRPGTKWHSHNLLVMKPLVTGLLSRY